MPVPKFPIVRRAFVSMPLLLALWVGAPAAASERDRLLVTTGWLAAHLGDPNLVLLHVGDPGEYAEAHLPGARLTSQRELSAASATPAAPPPAGSPELSLQMSAPELLRQQLEALGISDDSRIVVYFGNDWVSPATRILFTLDYAGLGSNASLLDGGQPAWVREGHAVTAQVPAARTGKLKALAPRPTIVDAKFVLDHRASPGFSVVDARDAVFYDGVEIPGRGSDKQRAGHIAGARSVPFSSTTDDELKLLPASGLEALFARAGVRPEDVIIGYCHIGQQATAMLFAARSLGREVRLYDGSFEDWSRHADYPVEVPPPAAAAAAAGEATAKP
ncbi:MAG: rhodanese-like domain-containing protein [Thermoanaerobaculia bacterium]